MLQQEQFYVGPQRKTLLSSDERKRGENAAVGVYTNCGFGVSEVRAGV